MLHVIQVVMWGAAEAPLIYGDAGQAHAAYVDCVRTRWGQRYGAYCEHHGADGDSFTTAGAFIRTVDVSEKSTVHYWQVSPQGEAGPAGQPDGRTLRQVGAGIDAVRDGLTRLLAEVTELAEQCGRADAVPAAAASCEAAGTQPPSPAEPAAAEVSPEDRMTPEWREFVALIQRYFSNSRNQATLLPRDDWRQDVYSHLTSLEYWDWVADRTKRFRDEAEKAGYTVAAEEGVLGCFRFANRDGIGSDECYRSEWEAWCAAALHLKAGGLSG